MDLDYIFADHPPKKPYLVIYQKFREAAKQYSSALIDPNSEDNELSQAYSDYVSTIRQFIPESIWRQECLLQASGALNASSNNEDEEQIILSVQLAYMMSRAAIDFNTNKYNIGSHIIMTYAERLVMRKNNFSK